MGKTITVRGAFQTAFQALADHPDEDVVTVWCPSDGPPDFCVTAKRLPEGPPEAVYFQPSPHEAVIWLADDDREDLWRAAHGGTS